MVTSGDCRNVKVTHQTPRPTAIKFMNSITVLPTLFFKVGHYAINEIRK